MSISPSAEIHRTAVVEDGATLGEGVRVGPFCTVGAEVSLGEGVELISHVAVAGVTSVGARTRIFPFASIGHQPQDLKYRGERTELHIGENNQIREHVTMNPGTEGGGGVTRIGSGGLYMMGVHVGHDCQLGDGVIMANNATLAGHVEVGDNVFFGGLSAVHQFTRIGAQSMVGGMTGIGADLIPYGMAIGNRGWLQGLNIVGLKRRGADRETIHALRAAYRDLFEAEGNFADKVGVVAEKYPDIEPVQDVVRFIGKDSSRSFLIPRAE